MHKHALLPIERIERYILNIRGQKVILDRDLANLYQVPTKRLNEQVKRNIKRFPGDFIFELSKNEKDEVVANCDHLSMIKYSNRNPCAFTEHGALMLASALNSPIAIKISVEVVRAFIKLRELAYSNNELANKVNELEKKYDSQFKTVFEVIRQLMPNQKIRKIRLVSSKEKNEHFKKRFNDCRHAED